MASKGRSLDDLPLAAYSTGMLPDAALEAADDVVEPAAEAAAGHPAVAATSAPTPGGADELPADPYAFGPPPEVTPLARARELASRNPRVAAAACVALIVVGVLMLGSGGPAPSASGATASSSAPASVTVAAGPGVATLVLTGAIQATYSLTGDAGGAPASSTVTETWTDTLQTALTIDGPVDRGTRTTDARLVLSWVVDVEGTLVTFTSKAGECTVGMASQPKGVSGSFTCKKLKSDDGTLTVGASGTYRT